ncbi:hypothetical protein B4Q04_04945 [Zobellia sp. OII3]|nr:hypothetical protein B4Q04_04945 [Zobellia sp. OII3]
MVDTSARFNALHAEIVFNFNNFEVVDTSFVFRKTYLSGYNLSFSRLNRTANTRLPTAPCNRNAYQNQTT